MGEDELPPAPPQPYPFRMPSPFPAQLRLPFALDPAPLVADLALIGPGEWIAQPLRAN